MKRLKELKKFPRLRPGIESVPAEDQVMLAVFSFKAVFPERLHEEIVMIMDIRNCKVFHLFQHPRVIDDFAVFYLNIFLK